MIRVRAILLSLFCAGVLSACKGRTQSGTMFPRGQVQGVEQMRTDVPTTQPGITAFGTASRTVIGTSVQGRPIEEVRFGTGEPTLLIIAGIHGNEPESWYVADQLIQSLESLTGPVAYGSVIVIPRANPDGCAMRRRVNARGVDVNRNFPASNWRATDPGPEYTGPSPASEPETTALIHAIEECKPREIITIHSITRGRECNNFDGTGAALAATLGRYNGYPVKDNIGYETPGSFGSWAGIDHHLAVVTLELPRRVSRDLAWTSNRDALLAVITQGPAASSAHGS